MLRPAPAPGPGGAALVHLVGGAAGPLGGDELRLDLVVGPGAHLAVRGVAATLALPGAAGPGARGRITIRAVVAEGACLDWAPEPTIVARGADLHVDTRLAVAAGGRLRWCEELVLGRTGEVPGRVAARTRLTVGPLPALDHVTTAGGPPGPWDGPGGLAGHRWIGSALHVGPGPPAPTPPDHAPVSTPEARAATLRLPDGSWLTAATAADRRAGRRVVDWAFDLASLGVAMEY